MILVWALIIAATAWFAYQILEILLLFFLAIILSAALEPSIQRLMTWRFPRSAAIATVYAGLFVCLFGILSLLLPALFSQTRSVVTNLPDIVGQWGISEEKVKQLSNEASALFGGTDLNEEQFLKSLFSTTVGVVKAFVGILAVIAMSLYILAVDGGVEKFFVGIVPKRYREYVVPKAMEAYRKTGRWLAGQAFLMGVVFAVYFVLLSILGVPGAFALAVWGGLFEIVPYIGPTMSAIPAVLLGLSVSPFIGVLVLISYAVIQKLENYWLVPKVMERAIGLHPLVIILALLAGGKTAGFLGLLLAVPLATVASVFLRDMFDGKKE